MHWYDGSIAEAVTLSKQKNTIFVVFVEGENELSAEMATTLDDAAVVKRLSDQKNFLAVKLKSGSTNYTHFAQIYQFVPVPSLFFIGRNGTPLEVVCAGVQPDHLATRIDRILNEHHSEKPPSTGGPAVHPSTSSHQIKEQTTDLIQSEATAPGHAPADIQPETSSGPPAKVQKTHHEVTKSGQEYEVICNDEVCVRVPKGKTDPGPSQEQRIQSEEPKQTESGPTESVSTISIEEKMDRAKELLEARKREKAEKEKELERQKELDRRAAGQGVAELKRWQAEQELKQLQEERKREKLENNQARQRILEQIAQDRAERRAREVPQVSPVPATSNQVPATAGDGSMRARIQFKLPDGSSHTAHFQADAALRHVHTYVADNLQLSTSQFSLWTAFPRRELTETDATLLELQLAPSAAVLVLPRRSATTVASPSAFANLISFFTNLFSTFILEPSQQLYAWLYVRLFAPRPSGDARPSAPRPAPSPSPAPPTIRRRGNIHRLPGDRTSDDDNNTWNGNSTQQM